MKILCSGCSFTKDYWFKTWPDYIGATKNIGIRGAGPDLVGKRTLIELQENKYDMCIVLWPNVSRIDWFIDTNENKTQALEVASWQKQAKRTFVNLHGQEVEMNGYSSSGWRRGYLEEYYKTYYSETQHQINLWYYVHTFQMYCKIHNIANLSFFVDSEAVCGKSPFNIQQDNVIFDQGKGFHEMLTSKGHKPKKELGWHFDTEAQEDFADFVTANLIV